MILIVEDNAETRYLLERLLAIKGYTPVSAADAVEALARLRTGPQPDVIILDLHLPTMDGRTFLRELRAEPQLGAIPVVAYSGDPGDVSDVAAFVRKGADPDMLLAAVARCLEAA